MIGEPLNLCSVLFFIDTNINFYISMSSQPNEDIVPNSNSASTKRGRGRPKGSKSKSSSGPIASLTSVDIDSPNHGPGHPKKQQPQLTAEVRIVVCIP